MNKYIKYDPSVKIQDTFYDTQVKQFLSDRGYGCMDRHTIPYCRDGEAGVFYEVKVAFDGAGRPMRRTQFMDILMLIRYISLYSRYLLRYTDLAGQVSEWKCETTEEALDQLATQKAAHEFGDWQLFKQAEDEDITGLFPGPDPVICRFYDSSEGFESWSWMLRQAEYKSLGDGKTQMKKWQGETRDGYGQIYISIYHVERKTKEIVKAAAAVGMNLFV